MKKFYQYMENVRNIILYENTKISDEFKKAINSLANNEERNYKNKNIKIFEKQWSELEFINFFTDENNWVKHRHDSMSICFITLEYDPIYSSEEEYVFYYLTINESNPPTKENIETYLSKNNYRCYLNKNGEIIKNKYGEQKEIKNKELNLYGIYRYIKFKS